MYFTILDFRNATDLFADKEFDGEPIRIKPVPEDEDLSLIVIEEEENSTTCIDEITGEEIKFQKASIRYRDGSTSDGSGVVRKPRKKFM